MMKLGNLGLALCLALSLGLLPFSSVAQSGSPGKRLEVAELLAHTERWLVVHVVDGHVVHHGKGQKSGDERTVVCRIDVARADRAESWTITSSDDPAYKSGKTPMRVARKTRGCDFSARVESWRDGHAVNQNPDHALEHWIYLEVPSPLREGSTVTVSSGDLLPGEPPLALRYDARSSRSEAVHVNLVGYPASSPAKYGYVYSWMGDGGSLEARALEGRPFRLIDVSSGTAAYTGTLKFRFSKDQPETLQVQDSPPSGNYLKADVCECDFSAFSRAGAYVLSVEGVGCSFPFKIGEDVYREAFRTVI